MVNPKQQNHTTYNIEIARSYTTIKKYLSMKKLFLVAFFALLVSYAQSQVPLVVFQQDVQGFNGGLPLPAQENFVINGSIPELISRVKVDIYKNNVMKNLLYSGQWSRKEKDKSTLFKVFIKHSLRSNAEYTFKLAFYTKAKAEDHLQLVDMLQKALSEYVNSQTRIRREVLVFNKTPGSMLNDMNAIVRSAFNSYDLDAFSFSDIVIDKIKQIEALKIKGDANTVNSAVAMDELKRLLDSEIMAYLPQDINKLAYQSILTDYPTQKLPNVIGINVGYSATFFGDSNIGYTPFAGVSLPLGNSKFAPFMSRMSASVGVFLRDIKDENNLEYTGPLINKPIYFGLGYRLYDFIRLSAGGVMMEKNVVPSSNGIYIKPYVGVSIDLNLWLGLGNQRPYTK
jgi:hypothetical protein